MSTILNTKEACMFSVVTVCLNPGLNLENTVESIINQEFHDFELLIKDGCSTDGTCDILWQDKRIKFISSPDRGIFDAMNQALKLCQGKYIIFMNAGDQFADFQVLKNYSDAIAKNPEVDLFYGDVYKHQSLSKINIYPDNLSRFYIFTRMICHQVWCLKRSTYLAYGGFETKFPLGGDIRLFIKMIARDQKRYKHVRRIVAIYEGGGHSANLELLKDSLPWVDDMKKQVFSEIEYKIYYIVWIIWLFIKPYIYDNLIFRPLSLYRKFRVRLPI
jgi:glycosyltransferase involved in cell wall biosynthesis